MSKTEVLRSDVKCAIDRLGIRTLMIIKAIIDVEESDEIHEREDEEFFSRLPQYVKNEMEEAVAQLDSGGGIPHEEIMKRHPEWFRK